MLDLLCKGPYLPHRSWETGTESMSPMQVTGSQFLEPSPSSLRLRINRELQSAPQTELNSGTLLDVGILNDVLSTTPQADKHENTLSQFAIIRVWVILQTCFQSVISWLSWVGQNNMGEGVVRHLLTDQTWSLGKFQLFPAKWSVYEPTEVIGSCA